MTVAVWPQELPRPLRSAYQAQRADSRLRQGPEGAPPGWRLRYSSAPETVALAVRVPLSGRARFRRFLTEEIGRGTLPFWMPDPTMNGLPMLEAAGPALTTPEGTPILLSARWLCLMADEQPAETLQGVTYTLSFRVWVMP